MGSTQIGQTQGPQACPARTKNIDDKSEEPSLKTHIETESLTYICS